MPVPDPRKEPLDFDGKPPEGGRVMQVPVEEEALVRLYRSLSSESRGNVIRYADAVRNIESVSQLASESDAR